jgi:quinol monooxygenase YgiN
MYTRLFYAEVQQGKEEQAWKVLDEFVPRVKQRPGCIFNQTLRSGTHVVGITSWKTNEELAQYADSDLARELWGRITPFLLGAPDGRRLQPAPNRQTQPGLRMKHARLHHTAARAAASENYRAQRLTPPWRSNWLIKSLPQHLLGSTGSRN